jgi:ribonuclease BN (tRNA processing enzyme)
MKLKVIGSGDAFGSGGNMNTCFHLQTANFQFLIDCGATSLVGLKKHGIEPADLDFILISHLHGDHFGGLPFILLDFLRKPRAKDITIIGPKGIEEKTLALLAILYPSLQNHLDVRFLKFEVYQSDQKNHYPQFILETFKVVHSEPSLPHGLKLFIDDKIIAFSGDTEWTNQLIPLALDADLFICECNWFHFEGVGHLNYQTIQQNINQLRTKRILLTHLSEDGLKNRNEIELPIATDGLIVTF